MKQIRCFFILFIALWLNIESVYAQQITFKGRKYDYKFVFQGYSIEEKEKLVGKMNGPLSIYLSREGYGVTIYGKNSIPFSFNASICKVVDAMDKVRYLINLSKAYGNEVDETIEELSKVNHMQAVLGETDLLGLYGDGKAKLLIFEDGSCSFEHYNNKNVLISVTPLKQTRKQALSKIYAMVRDELFLKGESATKRIKKTAEDGFVWYEVSNGGLYGVEDEHGNVIIPMQYEEVCYLTNNFIFIGNIDNGPHYFRVCDKKGVGVFTRKGKCVIPTTRGIKNVCMLSTNEGDIAWAVQNKEENNSIHKGWTILDARGNTVISVLEKTPIWIIIFYRTKFGALVFSITPCTDDENEALVTNGLYDSNGTEVVPIGKYDGICTADFAIMNPNQPVIRTPLTDINLGEIPYNFTTDTRFDYDSYDDLYYKWD